MQLLWQDEREQKQLPSKQTFADLGCGNGLLVYILTSEGVRDLIVMTSIRRERERLLALRLWYRCKKTKDLGHVRRYGLPKGNRLVLVMTVSMTKSGSSASLLCYFLGNGYNAV